MADEHNQQLVEYCSSPDFDISEVLRLKHENEERNQVDFTKYENQDFDLLVE